MEKHNALFKHTNQNFWSAERHRRNLENLEFKIHNKLKRTTPNLEAVFNLSLNNKEITILITLLIISGYITSASAAIQCSKFPENKPPSDGSNQIDCTATPDNRFFKRFKNCVEEKQSVVSDKKILNSLIECDIGTETAGYSTSIFKCKKTRIGEGKTEAANILIRKCESEIKHEEETREYKLEL